MLGPFIIAHAAPDAHAREGELIIDRRGCSQRGVFGLAWLGGLPMASGAGSSAQVKRLGSVRAIAIKKVSQ